MLFYFYILFVLESNICWVEEHPECSVCLQPCLQPVQLPCQHIFCFLCLKGFAYRSKKCALCRREVLLKYFEDPIVVSNFFFLLFFSIGRNKV